MEKYFETTRRSEQDPEPNRPTLMPNLLLRSSCPPAADGCLGLRGAVRSELCVLRLLNALSTLEPRMSHLSHSAPRLRDTTHSRSRWVITSHRKTSEKGELHSPLLIVGPRLGAEQFSQYSQGADVPRSIIQTKPLPETWTNRGKLHVRATQKGPESAAGTGFLWDWIFPSLETHY